MSDDIGWKVSIPKIVNVKYKHLLTAIPRVEYQSIPDIIDMLNGALTEARDNAYTCGFVALFNKDTKGLTTFFYWDKEVEVLNCIELLKLRHIRGAD